MSGGGDATWATCLPLTHGMLSEVAPRVAFDTCPDRSAAPLIPSYRYTMERHGIARKTTQKHSNDTAYSDSAPGGGGSENTRDTIEDDASLHQARQDAQTLLQECSRNTSRSQLAEQHIGRQILSVSGRCGPNSDNVEPAVMANLFFCEFSVLGVQAIADSVEDFGCSALLGTLEMLVSLRLRSVEMSFGHFRRCRHWASLGEYRCLVILYVSLVPRCSNTRSPPNHSQAPQFRTHHGHVYASMCYETSCLVPSVVAIIGISS